MKSSQKIAEDVARKFEQCSGHADALQAAIGRGDWERAWQEAVKLRSSSEAARHLVTTHARVSRVERESKLR